MSIFLFPFVASTIASACQKCNQEQIMNKVEFVSLLLQEVSFPNVTFIEKPKPKLLL